ncbi:hypothetical protein K504DRAFT_470436 [Pleomassaria siparia CBS 279.74]|uniref:NADH:ubiquinone oxidoreductase 20.1kD subunit n=1 Tax=Pleomassaria siparia CBS 279.74 TaxID=1314801 RepID=A0A6G1K3Z3_9PLEO|nr:hypothetical protein K504DRAFT_470436 [Pleomassaria siparia CBS 279.74]
MLSRRIAAARPLTRALIPAAARPLPQFTQVRTALTQSELLDIVDPNINGGYINPKPEKPQYRDPYGEYFDKQERRNFNDPVHEDHDIYSALSLHDYDHFTPGWGGVLLGTFLASVLGMCAVVSFIHPDKVSVPKQYEDGLEAELGGPRTVRAAKHGDEHVWRH